MANTDKSVLFLNIDGSEYYLPGDASLYIPESRYREIPSQVPRGISIPANADLNTVTYLSVNKYYCSSDANTQTLSNCPSQHAFMMEVYSPLSTAYDNESTSTWVYRIRKMMTYKGAQYIQYVYSGATAGTFTYGNWKLIGILAPGSLGSGTQFIYHDGTEFQKSTSTIGSTTKPIYLNAGVITASNATKGSGTKPIYLNAGEITESSSTIGSGVKPIYLSSGTITQSTSTLGGTTTAPICLVSGELKACTSLNINTTGSSGSCTGNSVTATTAINATNIYSSASTTKAYVLGTTTASSANHATVYNASVYTSGSVLYGAAWNDYAEYRETAETIEAGRVVCENNDDTLSLSQERLQPGAEIVSDTFGFAIGETEKCKTPIAASGRVLAYPYEDRNTYRAGDAVCAAPNGTVSKMTREEIREYPERIIGTVSAVPEYETWGENNVPVNGRIWIRIK